MRIGSHDRRGLEPGGAFVLPAAGRSGRAFLSLRGLAALVVLTASSMILAVMAVHYLERWSTKAPADETAHTAIERRATEGSAASADLKPSEPLSAPVAPPLSRASTSAPEVRAGAERPGTGLRTDVAAALAASRPRAGPIATGAAAALDPGSGHARMEVTVTRPLPAASAPGTVDAPPAGIAIALPPPVPTSAPASTIPPEPLVARRSADDTTSSTKALPHAAVEPGSADAPVMGRATAAPGAPRGRAAARKPATRAAGKVPAKQPSTTGSLRRPTASRAAPTPPAPAPQPFSLPGVLRPAGS